MDLLVDCLLGVKHLFPIFICFLRKHRYITNARHGKSGISEEENRLEKSMSPAYIENIRQTCFYNMIAAYRVYTACRVYTALAALWNVLSSLRSSLMTSFLALFCSIQNVRISKLLLNRTATTSAKTTSIRKIGYIVFHWHGHGTMAKNSKLSHIHMKTHINNNNG